MRLHPLLTVLGRDATFAALVNALKAHDSGPRVLSAITPARAYAPGATLEGWGAPRVGAPRDLWALTGRGS